MEQEEILSLSLRSKSRIKIQTLLTEITKLWTREYGGLPSRILAGVEHFDGRIDVLLYILS